MAYGFTLFDTAIGRCGIAWSERGVVAVQLPEARDSATRTRMLKQWPEASEGAPPPHASRAIERIAALLRGDSTDLSEIALDMDRVPPFHRRVYEAARRIAPGRTLSYGELAAELGDRGSARSVGYALGRNPFAIVVPCHRVLAAGGKIGGFSADGGVVTKLRLLSIENAQAQIPALFDGDGAYGFDPATAVDHVRGADPRFGRVIDGIGPFGLRLQHSNSVFAALAEAIVYQQLNGRAAATIYARVCALHRHAHRGLTAEHILRTPDEKLRSAGLSRSKLLSLRDLARRAAAGDIPTLAEIGRMADGAVIERLTEVRGIGRWTAEMFLIFRLGRPDVLPLEDYGIRKGFAATFGKGVLPSREALERRGARWRPYRTIASWYLWQVAERAVKQSGGAAAAGYVLPEAG